MSQIPVEVRHRSGGRGGVAAVVAPRASLVDGCFPDQSGLQQHIHMAATPSEYSRQRYEPAATEGRLLNAPDLRKPVLELQVLARPGEVVIVAVAVARLASAGGGGFPLEDLAVVEVNQVRVRAGGFPTARFGGSVPGPRSRPRANPRGFQRVLPAGTR